MGQPEIWLVHLILNRIGMYDFKIKVIMSIKVFQEFITLNYYRRTLNVQVSHVSGEIGSESRFAKSFEKVSNFYLR